VTKTSTKWMITWMAVAVAAFLVVQMLQLQALPGQKISPDKLSWRINQKNYAIEDANYSISQYAAPDYQFAGALAVEAEVIKVLPDIYIRPAQSSSSQRYRILYMRTKDVVYGENIPSEFYYLLPDFLSPGLKQYDSLIMAVTQAGSENFLMINESKRRVETFTMLFHCGYYDPDQGGLMAFKDGQLALSLWDMDGWNQSRESALYMTSAGEDHPYPGRSYRDVQQTKDAILKQNALLAAQGVISFEEPAVITNDVFDWPEARELLEYVEPFKNGTFHTRYNTKTQIVFSRMIDGFITNEQITIDAKSKTQQHSGVYFTDADMKKLPDMVKIMEQVPAMEPPEEGLRFCGITAEYRKVAEDIFGILYVQWGDPDVEESRLPTCCPVMKVRKSVLLLVYPDGSWKEAQSYDSIKDMIRDFQQQ